MTKLISLYASATGLLIDRPNVKEAFFPHPYARFITVQTGAGQNAKCYDYWQEVIALLKPILDANHIAILHLGGKDDPPLQGVHDLRGKTSYLQSVYLVKRALCHMGNDSWLAHCAGWNHRPLVVLYGSTDEAHHGPYWSDTANTVLITSHRAGGKPTFVMQEAPKTVNWIGPEQPANAVLRLLGIADQSAFTTTYIGPLYAQAVLELIPNTCPPPTFHPELPITVRMDHLFNEDILLALLQSGRKVHVITKREVNLGLLNQFRAQVLSYQHELTPGVGEPPLAYVDTLRMLFPTNHAFFTKETDERKVADLRLTYLDHILIGVQRDPTRDDWVGAVLVYTNRKDTPENRLDICAGLSHTRFKSNRYLCSDSKVYLSYAHMTANQPIDSMAANSGAVLDDPAFFSGAMHYLTTYHP